MYDYMQVTLRQTLILTLTVCSSLLLLYLNV